MAAQKAGAQALDATLADAPLRTTGIGHQRARFQLSTELVKRFQNDRDRLRKKQQIGFGRSIFQAHARVNRTAPHSLCDGRRPADTDNAAGETRRAQREPKGTTNQPDSSNRYRLHSCARFFTRAHRGAPNPG